ncbi:MAG: outer membrane protein assembly factor BamA [Thermodesulfobacteriota bacterium]
MHIPPVFLRCWRQVFFLLLVSCLVPTAFAAAPESPLEKEVPANTLFLPVTINAPGDVADLETKIDEILRAASGSRGQKFVEREELGELLDPAASCPPPAEIIAPLLAGAAYEYVVCGSLTRVGARFSVDLIAYNLPGDTTGRSFYQQAADADDLPFVMERLVDNIVTHTGRQHQIAKIIISGNTRIDSGAILRNISNRAGDRYNPGQLGEDLKNIYKMGYFNDVRLRVDEVAEGKNVTFEVVEKEVVASVTISGEDNIDADKIKEVLTVSQNTILNPRELKISAENIRNLYKEKGYYDTEVTTKLTYPDKEKVNVLFEIKEGNKIYVKEIVINGNTTFSNDEIKETITTSTKTIFSWITESGLLKRDVLQQDAARIGAFYQNQGFIDALVGDPVVEKKEDWLSVTFNITEGDRYKVGIVDITGDMITDKASLEAMTKIGEERYFSRQVLRDDVLAITDYYASKGYAFAEVVPNVTKNKEEKRVDVTLQINKGDLVHINRIIIRGNTRTRDKVIRRNLEFDEQSVYDATAIKKSTEKLQYLDFFEDINITPEPTDEDNLMDVLVELKEKPTGTFSVGAGYSSADGMLFMADVTQHNFLGRGQSLSLQGNIGGTNSRYSLSFTEPRLNDSQISFGFDIYQWNREYDDYDKDSTGAAIRLGYPIWEKWRVWGKWAYDDSELSEVSEDASYYIRESMDINITHSVTVGLSRDSRNHRYSPTKGSYHTISVQKAGGPLGGDSSFTKYEGLTSWYFPFYWSTTFHTQFSAGYVTEDQDGRLPVYEKFYLGGLNTVRGFEYGDISPRDPLTNEKIGGEKMVYMNLEYIFPLVKDIGLNALIFYDMGNAVRDSDSLTTDLRSSVGFGFRWLSPMGPLRLEWGYNLDAEDDEDQSMWDFSIGGMF